MKIRSLSVVALVAAGAITAAVAHPKPAASADAAMPPVVARGIAELRPDTIKAHTRFLSHDLLEGRAPGTRGGTLTELYIAAQFEALGLIPAGDDGTYFQKVPLVGLGTKADATTLRLVGPNGARTLRWADEIVGSNERQQPVAQLDFPLVFVGHGVDAPEYRWDDFKGVDLRGKVAVMLADDPPATADEPDLFGGKARTYYGRWTYKYESALEKGAAGAIIIHTDRSAGYGWSVVRNSWGRERPYVKLADGENALTLAAWIPQSVGEEIMRNAGRDLEAMIAAAGRRDFRPVELNQKIEGTITSTLGEMVTHNVVAKLEGSDPKLRHEAVIYSAHHDHLGIGTPDESGDAIYNGALDNATGVGTIIELARVWSKMEPRPRRSILFAAVAAEEGGLRGSQYQAAHPHIPAGRTALNLNYDMIEQFGRVRNISLVGAERTTIYPTVQRIAAAMNLRIDPDLAPEQGLFYRSDHFSFAKAGVPAFSVKSGGEFITEEAKERKAAFLKVNPNFYHQPSDEFSELFDFSQSVQIAEFGLWLGWEAANMDELPTWREGDEFRAARDRSFAAVR
jgi:Zn-dependent M28 family amino/carboxypeptidase